MQDNRHDWRTALRAFRQAVARRSRVRDRSIHLELLEHALADAGERVRHARDAQRQRETAHVAELARLQQRMAIIESERNAARRRIRTLQAALASPSSRRGRALNLPTLAASVLLVLGALASATSFQDRRDPWRPLIAGTSATNATAMAEVTAPVPPRSARTRTGAMPGAAPIRPGTAKPVVHRQWGPLLRLPPVDAGAASGKPGFDALVERQQTDLLALGFDLGQARADGLMGPRTGLALAEFQSLYVAPGGRRGALKNSELASLLGVYAQLAREDARRFGIDRGVLAAIRLASVRTGVEFPFLMELAAAESNFDPLAQADGSSAAGLYQFTHDTWLDTVKQYGEKYGLGDYALQIEYVVDRAGNRRPVVRDTEAYRHLLDLRLNPRFAALMAAESAGDHGARLATAFDRKPARTELYLTHFLGPDDGLAFLRGLDENPGRFAAELFPEAAQNNHGIFHPKTCQPRTLNQVYEMFSRKFDTARYELQALN